MEYLPIDGLPEFRAETTKLILGKGSKAIKEGLEAVKRVAFRGLDGETVIADTCPGETPDAGRDAARERRRDVIDMLVAAGVPEAVVACMVAHGEVKESALALAVFPLFFRSR